MLSSIVSKKCLKKWWRVAKSSLSFKFNEYLQFRSYFLWLDLYIKQEKTYLDLKVKEKYLYFYLFHLSALMDLKTKLWQCAGVFV